MRGGVGTLYSPLPVGYKPPVNARLAPTVKIQLAPTATRSNGESGKGSAYASASWKSARCRGNCAQLPPWPFRPETDCFDKHCVECDFLLDMHAEFRHESQR